MTVWQGIAKASQSRQEMGAEDWLKTNMLEPEKQLENPQEKPSFQGSKVQHSFSEVFFGSSFKAFQRLT